jgi:glucokinase
MRIEEHTALVADIGGTHARFAIVDESGTTAPRVIAKVACANYTDLYSAVAEQLDAIPEHSRPRRAAIALAAVVSSDRVKLTNLKWEFSVQALKHQLDLDELLLLNDFEALAWSLPHLRDDDLRQIGGGASRIRGPRAVIGPGTGLGVSGLIPSRGGWAAIRGEGGHVSFSPADERENAILASVWKRFPHVSAERLVSGIGLPVLHQAVCEVDGHRFRDFSTAEIVQGALDGTDAGCASTIATFCAMLGTIAGNLALTLGATGGVFIGGGIVPRLGDAFERSAFRARFEAKGRFTEHNAAIPTHVIVADTPALIGAAAALEDLQYAAEPVLHSPRRQIEADEEETCHLHDGFRRSPE